MTARVILLSESRDCQKPTSDEALVAACASGDEQALRVLFRRHEVAVTRFVAHVLGAEIGETDDIVQQAFVSAWQTAKRFQGRGSVRSWLFGIAANHARQFLRKKRRRAALSERFFVAPVSSISVTGEDHAREQQALARLGRALADLSPDLRIAFILCDVEDVSGKEAAEALRVRPGTLWRRLHQARKELRAALQEDLR